MSKPIKLVATICLCFTLIFNATGCGTILYPERKGQIDGQLDTGVVALNAIGLLFFLIPGVIAFAVDFSNGTIYLPNTGRAEINPKILEQISEKEVTIDQLQTILEQQTDIKDIDISLSHLHVTYLKDINQIDRLLELTYKHRSFASL